VFLEFKGLQKPFVLLSTVHLMPTEPSITVAKQRPMSSVIGPAKNFAVFCPRSVKICADFLFTGANKWLFAQWKQGESHDFIWEYHHCNFFANFSCHHNM
jgi:hypothetical protein